MRKKQKKKDDGRRSVIYDIIMPTLKNNRFVRMSRLCPDNASLIIMLALPWRGADRRRRAHWPGLLLPRAEVNEHHEEFQEDDPSG
jgi:hypothetical protein